MKPPVLSISEIWIYPVKSLRGIKLKRARLTDRGLEWDRRWMLLDETGQFITQRKFAKMALLDVHLHQHQLEVRHRTKEMPPLYLPLTPENSVELVKAPIWDDTSDAIVVSQEADKWFSKALEQNCRLVQMPEKATRTVTGKTSGRIQKVSFADAYPILMIGQSSLDDLNNRLTAPVPINRFRPNLVFTGGKAFEEDTWHAFTAGGTRFWSEKPSARCVMTTIDQETGRKGKEPLATLAKYRNLEGKTLFGQNLLYEAGGSIGIGDSIVIESHKEAPFL